ncbi:MAG TPA: carboxypeptidase regulatory-like domain-containing protein, partial [Longimicrobiaceae bacterium]|nr:carboxypeptidase regulatory-like domain-containing protein [Longimicrobiaceae bacterium]
MRRLKAAALIGFFAAVSGAQTCAPANGGAATHQLRGVVVTQGTGRPVPDATVSIAGIQQQGITNVAGEFALCYVPAGTHQVAVAVPGVAAVTTRRVAVPLPPGSPRLSLEVPPGRDRANVAAPQSFV